MPGHKYVITVIKYLSRFQEEASWLAGLNQVEFNKCLNNTEAE